MKVKFSRLPHFLFPKEFIQTGSHADSTVGKSCKHRNFVKISFGGIHVFTDKVKCETAESARGFLIGVINWPRACRVSGWPTGW